MLYVVSYDIPDTKRRTKLAKTIKDFGDRVQYSVFECILDGDLIEELVDRIERIVVEKEDKVRIYGLCGTCERAVKIMGKGEVTKDEDVYVI